MRWLDGLIDSMDMSLSKLQETVKNMEAWHAEAREIAKESDTTEQLSKNQDLGIAVVQSLILITFL